MDSKNTLVYFTQNKACTTLGGDTLIILAVYLPLYGISNFKILLHYIIYSVGSLPIF